MKVNTMLANSISDESAASTAPLTKREATAYHEAGHIVACLLNNVPVYFATIKPDIVQDEIDVAFLDPRAALGNLTRAFPDEFSASERDYILTASARLLEGDDPERILRQLERQIEDSPKPAGTGAGHIALERIIADIHRLGRVTHGATEDGSIDKAVTRAVIAYAGFYAEEFRTDKKNYRGARSDFRKAEIALTLVADSPAELKCLKKLAKLKAQRIPEHSFDAMIVPFAQALLEHETIDAETIDDIWSKLDQE